MFSLIGDWLARKVVVIAGIGAAALAAFLGFKLLLANVEIRHLTSVNARQHELINDPKTGYLAQLAQARTNTATMETALTSQSQNMRDISTREMTALAKATESIRTSAAEQARASELARSIVAYRPVGDTACQRLLDLDALLVESLK